MTVVFADQQTLYNGAFCGQRFMPMPKRHLFGLLMHRYLLRRSGGLNRPLARRLRSVLQMSSTFF